MLNTQRLIRSCMIKRSDNISYIENSSSHQNELENHADEKFKLQESTEQTNHIFHWLTSEVH